MRSRSPVSLLLSTLVCLLGCAAEIDDEDALASLSVVDGSTIGPSGEVRACGVNVCFELSADEAVAVDEVVIQVDLGGVVDERMYGSQTVTTEAVTLCNGSDGAGTHDYRIDIIRGEAVRTEMGTQTIACD